MNCTVLSTSVGLFIDYVIYITVFITFTFILDREFKNNQLLFKEILTNITSFGTINPKYHVKWLRLHLQEVSLHDNLVSSAFGYEAFAVTRETPFYSRLTRPHALSFYVATPRAIFAARCSLVTHQRQTATCLDTHRERLNHQWQIRVVFYW